MRITPIDIQQHRFKTRALGYDKTGVDQFLETLADELERQHKELQTLREELGRTGKSLDEMRQRERTLKETLLTTQQMTSELKANARKEAEIVIADAKLQAERILRDADERRLQLIDEIQELKRQKVAFETGLRALVESHLKLLDLDVLAIEGGDPKLIGEPLPFDLEHRPPRRRPERG